MIETLPDHARVAAVYDPLPARRGEAVQRFGCAAHEDFAGLIADPGVDVVVVAVPSHLHADYSVAALHAGRHVVCEKPMATSVADAERMTAAAAESGKLLTVFQNYRYRGDVDQGARSGRLRGARQNRDGAHRPPRVRAPLGLADPAALTAAVR